LHEESDYPYDRYSPKINRIINYKLV